MNIFGRILLFTPAILALNMVQVSDLFAQESPQFINYQAVARNASGNELGGVFLDVEFSIYEGSVGGSPVYVEVHSEVQTDPFGLFSLKIGNGSVLEGNFSTIDWSQGTYLNVSIDDGNGISDLGNYQLVSVPYSFYSSKSDSASYGADEDADPTNEIQQLVLVGDVLTLSGDNSGTQIDLSTFNSDDQQLSIDTGDPENISISLDNSNSVAFSIEDADADSTNELQSITKVGDQVTLSDNGGSFTDEVNDADADPTNEIQSISKLGETVTLSGDGGSFIDAVDDADADPANEFQTISKTGSTVTLSDGGGSFSDAVDDADADPVNEIQTIAKVGSTVTLSNGGGSFSDAVNDADADPVNEIQTISKVGSTVTLSNGGGSFIDAVNDADANSSNELISNISFNSSNNLLTVTEAGSDQSADLSELKNDKNWTNNGLNVSNSNLGNVGINESNPSSTFHIMGSTAAKVRVEGPSGTSYLLGDETIFIGKPTVGDVEVDLPSAASVPGRIYIIKKGDPNVNNDLKIHANGSDNVEGVSTYILGDISGVYEQVIIVSDGISDWWIISKD
jgi:hypothetical protein